MGKKKKLRFRRPQPIAPSLSTRWLARVPPWTRSAVLVGLALLGVPLLILALPAGLYFVFFSKDDPVAQPLPDGKSVLMALGVCLLLLLMAISTGATLLGVLDSGDLCSRPTRHAGLHCISHAAKPVLFVLSLAASWVVFWVCVLMLAAAARNFFKPSR